mmetsp:Transcript_31845/g.51529  ORF Transcript_31845/g.51529 Transcript_31845/m.51529 type:complete len:362 (-) Transcript_31845:105-1190(-)|eukprot:CAMPEP_0202686676 /NCGR_PEP_ID=MMETSP1385-20130828/2430_1 /ASSEMBLY_ACC=CAM_ASM_000861 /TAXON_ID=933848 /ORGANISM="Elphidium margaritaceum" /LENGTH=361 /DNA_ID=CAMNT_0049341305 /DNA_START=47 /DNA_END=1132 /DNA_ORIENTATION=+
MESIDELEMELNTDNDNEWNADSFQQRMNKVTDISSQLGTLLLQGWTMMAEECNVCHTPLMCQKGQSPQCVTCHPVGNDHDKTTTMVANKPITSKNKSAHSDQHSQREEQKQKTSTSEEQQLSTSNNKLWSIDEAQMRKRHQTSDDASEKVGQLLLRGWTMLAQHCNKCQTPMMSLRGGPAMCCVCDHSKPSAAVSTAVAANGIDEQQSQSQSRNDNRSEIVMDRPVHSPDAVHASAAQPAKDYVPHVSHAQAGPPPLQPAYHHAPPHHSYWHSQHPPMSTYMCPMQHPHTHGSAAGLGAAQTESLKTTMDDIVKTVLTRMNAVNQTMKRRDSNMQYSLQQLQEMMTFLSNVQAFKAQMKY